MADQMDPFDAALADFQRFVAVDLDGDGRPDVMQPVTTADFLDETRERGRVARPSQMLPPYLRQQINDAQSVTGAFHPSVSKSNSGVFNVLGDTANFAAELTGIPSIVRGSRNIASGFNEGDPLRGLAGAGEVAIGALPGAGVYGPAANALFRNAPRAAATIAAPMAMTVPLEARENARSFETNAATAAMNDPIVQQLREERRRVMEERTRVNERHKRSGPKTQEKALEPFDNQLNQLDVRIQKAEEDAVSSYKDQAPFRKKYPGAVQAMLAGGAALALGKPLLTSAASKYVKGSTARNINREAESILAAANRTEPGPLAALLPGQRVVPPAELATRMQRFEINAAKADPSRSGLQMVGDAASNTSKALGSAALSGLTMAEATMLPEQIDYMTNAPGHPAREAAVDLMTRPSYWTERAGSALTGVGLGMFGYTLPHMVPRSRVDAGAVEAVRGLGGARQAELAGNVQAHRNALGQMPTNSGGGAGFPPAGGQAGGGVPPINLRQPQAPGQTAGPGQSPFAAYDQSGAHGQVARQLLDEMLTHGHPTRRALQAQGPDAMAIELDRRIAAAGLPRVDPQVLLQRAAETQSQLGRQAAAYQGTNASVTAPRVRQNVLSAIQGNPGQLAVPGMMVGGANALAQWQGADPFAEY